MTNLYLALAIIFFITTAILLYFVIRFARIIFILEDNLSEFHNSMLDTMDRIEEVKRIRVLLTHPTASKYVHEAFNELMYCDYVLLETVRQTKLLLMKDYSTEIKIDKDFPKLLNRLEENGIYDPEEDGGVQVIPVEEMKRQV